MKTLNKKFASIFVTLAICERTVLFAQVPAISISTDTSGQNRAFVAASAHISEHSADLFRSITNKSFTCTVVMPLTAGDVIASQVSSDQAWSVTTVPLLISTNNVQFPILASVTTSHGRIAVLPAVLKLKIDIKAGEGLQTEGFYIETTRPLKAGDSIPVLFMDGGPSIVSVESGDGSKEGSKTKPWLTAYEASESSEERQAPIEAWKIERDHVGL